MIARWAAGPVIGALHRFGRMSLLVALALYRIPDREPPAPSRPAWSDALRDHYAKHLLTTYSRPKEDS